MKIEKLLTFGFLLSIAIVACKDDNGEGMLTPPRADFAFTPTQPGEGDEILFYADPEPGSGEIVSWSWAFGDPEGTTSNKRNPYFTFATAGTYEVTLKVKNAANNSMEIARSVTVVPPPPDEFPASIVWEFSNNTTVGNPNEGSNSPAIADDGTIYYVEGNAGADSKVVAVTDEGAAAKLKWANGLGNQISNAPAIGPDGNISINAWLSNGIFKLNSATGDTLWSGVTTRQVSNNTTAVDSQGNLYHGSRSSATAGIFSWDTDGNKRWEIINIGAFYAAPALSKDEKTVYYLNTDTGEIWALNTADGTLKWDAPAGTGTGGYGPSLSVDGDGTIYFTTDEHVAAVTDNGSSGSLKWSTAISGAANSGVVIGPQGDLYTGSLDGLYALNPSDGTVQWSFEAEIKESVPAVDVNGNIYVGTTDGRLLIVDPAGLLLKEMELGDNIVNSPTITSDGTIYIEAMDGVTIKLYKIAVENSGPAASPWPMKGQNVKNTGKAI